MVEWESPRHCEHQTIKARQTVGAIGHGKLFLESASKQAKVFMAEEYFDQVDFAIAVFTIFWYPVHKAGLEASPKMLFASGNAWMPNLPDVEYLSKIFGRGPR
jgi:hypothetical protein